MLALCYRQAKQAKFSKDWDKVRDQDHSTGKYRGPAYRVGAFECQNLGFRSINF